MCDNYDNTILIYINKNSHIFYYMCVNVNTKDIVDTKIRRVGNLINIYLFIINIDWMKVQKI